MSKTPTYLSIDCDFWCDEHQMEEELTAVVRKAVQRYIPIRAVMNHHQLLSYVNASRARRLLNLDQHSDLADKEVEYLDCGTWISYVKWRREGKFHWHGPGFDRAQDCGEPRLFLPDLWGHPPQTGLSDWSQINYRLDDVCPGRILESCVEIGLCLSPDWVSQKQERIFRKIVKTYGLPYKKGFRDEVGRSGDARSKKVRPPGVRGRSC